MVQDVEGGRAADAEAALSAAPTAPIVAALPGNDQPRDTLFQELRDVLLASVGGYDRFERGFHARTFSPEKRASGAVGEAANCLESAMAVLAEAGIEPEAQRDWLARAVSKWAAYQQAGARTMNWMITGPAQFAVARNEKAMQTEHKRCDEYISFVGGARDWALRQQSKAKRRAAVEAAEASGIVNVERAFGNIRVVLNEALNRVQIIFPNKPTDNERRILKSHAFRWAPSVGAWQRQLTRNGVRAAKDAMHDMGLSA